MSSTSPRVVVVGELCADIVVELPGEIPFGQAETVVPSTVVTMGSSSAITACGLARLGVPTALIGVAGQDLLGGFVLERLAELGVDTQAVRIEPDLPTGSSTILTRPDGDRAILTALGTIGKTRVSDVPSQWLTPGVHVHVGSYFLQHDLHGEMAEWYAALRQRGITTSLDPNDDPSGLWDSRIRDVLPHLDVLWCNEEEATGITGDAKDPASALLELLPVGARVVVKGGASGARLLRRNPDGSVLDLSCPPPTLPGPLVDTVGAGDSLAAAHLAALLRPLPDDVALRAGVANGTASTRASGGVDGQLDWPALETALADR